MQIQTANETRSTKRFPIRCAGRLEVCGTALPMIVQDVSHNGIGLRVLRPASIWSHTSETPVVAFLTIDESRVEIPGRLVWSHENDGTWKAGIQLDLPRTQPNSCRVFARWVAGLERAALKATPDW